MGEIDADTLCLSPNDPFPRAADIADELARLRPAAACGKLAELPEHQAARVLERPEFVTAGEVLAVLPVERAAGYLDDMAADRAADALAAMKDESRKKVLEALPEQTRSMLRDLLQYPRDSAGGLMTTEYAAVPGSFTASQTLDHIRGIERSHENIYAVYVTDPKTNALIGLVPIRQILTASADEPISRLFAPDNVIAVPPDAPLETVARKIRRHDLMAIPVIDKEHKVLGIITLDDVLDAIVNTHTARAQRFGGLQALDRSYFDTSFWTMIRKRAGWLCALFLSEMLTASAMQHFESELEKAVVLTLFIPLIMSSGGNSGSQATSLIIRALAVGQIQLRDWWRVALRELPTGLVLGAILACVGIARITIWQLTGFYNYGEHWRLVALTVALGLIGIVSFGSAAGSMLPFVLQRLGFDPASASAPFVATLVDVTGLVIYFSIALVVLSGTLL